MFFYLPFTIWLSLVLTGLSASDWSRTPGRAVWPGQSRLPGNQAGFGVQGHTSQSATGSGRGQTRREDGDSGRVGQIPCLLGLVEVPLVRGIRAEGSYVSLIWEDLLDTGKPWGMGAGMLICQGFRWRYRLDRNGAQSNGALTKIDPMFSALCGTPSWSGYWAKHLTWVPCLGRPPGRQTGPGVQGKTCWSATSSGKGAEKKELGFFFNLLKNT